MTTTTATTYLGTSGDEPLNYINHQRGLMSWLTTLDHKRIGVMYLICILTAFALGGFFAILVRTEHFTPGPTIFHDYEYTVTESQAQPDGSTKDVEVTKVFTGADQYNQAFTLHGALMVFLFIIPGIPAALGNMVMPIMLGAKDVAFPRLNLMSWYLWMFGAVFFIVALLAGGLDTGWTFYTPYSSNAQHSVFGGVVWATAGVFILGFSSILTGVNFIATVHMLRAPGQSWFRLPLFVWALYSTAIIQILATPVLAITLLLLIAERVLRVGIFDPALPGGDPVLFQHFFWFYSHPAVYIMILPAMGVISEVIATFCHKHIFGYKFIAFSSLAIAILGFLVWGHHMFVSGQSDVMGTIFSLITFSIAVPSAIKVFNWLATMYKGSIELKSPMLYALSFIWVFSLGGLTGLHLATMVTDVHLHDTYFVVAHFHYVMVGGTVFAFLAGLTYWFPKMFGRMYNEFWSVIAWFFVFVGFNLTFFPQFFMGGQGMPRRYYNYVEEWQPYHVASSIGALMQGVGFILLAVVLIAALMKGRRAGRNPWGGASLEWQSQSPPVFENFAHPPIVDDPYDFDVVEYDAEHKTYFRKDRAAERPDAAH